MTVAPLDNCVFEGIRTMGIEFRDAYQLDEYELAKIMGICWKAHFRAQAISASKEIGAFKLKADYLGQDKVASVIVTAYQPTSSYGVQVSFSIDRNQSTVSVDPNQMSTLVPLVKESF